MSENTWNEMLDEFRALGGVANNVRLDYGPFGRGLFPIDPKKPVTIRIPDNLLVQLEHVVFENHAFRVSPASALDARARAFIERYEQDFSWGTTRIETERFLAMMNELPEALREMLTTQLDLGNFFQAPSPRLTATMFIAARAITASGGRRVIMPIIELANHGPGVRYDTQWGVSLHGQFDGEVLVRYTVPADPYDLFAHWMFAPAEPMAFSIKMNLSAGGKEIRIDREFNEEEAPWVPKVSVDGNRISLAYLLLGHRQFPRIPRGAFQRAMSAAGVDKAGEVFEIIQHVNRERFLDLLDALEGLDLPAVQPLRALARNQLRALSCYYGLRPV
jgi:hypothetical protein